MPRIPRSALALALALALSPLAAGAAGSAPADGLLGFTPERAAAQRSLEARFDAALDPANLRAWMERLAARPHPVGSPHGKENAELMAELFRSWGYQTRIEEFHVLLPEPRVRLVEMTAPERFTARLAEPHLGEGGDPAPQGALPPYNAYSVDGDVTAELVYVNQGVPADYEELERLGIDVRGKIVLARYGGSWRGIKPKVAAEHGALACILYSDPKDDGYAQGPVWPEGGWRPEAGAQRGSVLDMPLYPGDPLTPNVGATRDARRLPREQAPTLTRIPVLPISYGDALPLLSALRGPVAPPAWRGALPVTYRIGPGPATVRVKLEFDWKTVTAYDVIAVLQGAERPDEWIVRGNHHDAWVLGATDPVSGMVALLEEARAVGELAKTGWRPRRTLVYAAWDAEEPGLLGSVEWAEAHADLLRERAVAYINSDSNSRGFFYAGGSHTLEAFINEVARDVPDPRKGVSVAERVRAALLLDSSPAERAELAAPGALPIEPLGSGSDYTPFLQHLGIASLNLGFGGEGDYGQYHSSYDSVEHYVRFMDPTFEYGLALARVGGRAMLRLAEADVLPFEFTRFASTVGRYVEEVKDLADNLRRETEEHNRLVDQGVFELAADPAKPWVPRPKRDPVPHLNFAPLENALQAVQKSAARYDELMTGAASLPPEAGQRLDAVLLATERALTRAEGLPRRPWYRHHVYAPGFYTGYGVKTLPGVREALEQRSWKEAEEQIAVAAAVLETFAREVDRAAELAEGAPTGPRPAPGG